MGKLVEQTLRTMYQGVSRQPSTVRLPGQVEDAENVMFSVVSGGFSKRPGTQFFADTLLTYNDHAFYSYERDSNEKYLVVIGYNGVSDVTSSSAHATINVYGSNGSIHTVTAPSTALNYLATNNPSQDLSFATVGDTTFIANRLKTVAIYASGGFHYDTMPHQLIRNADGTFTFQMYTSWNQRPNTGLTGAAAEAVIPSPDFVGNQISDLTFHRDRLAIASDETVFFSASGDYTNFWPKTAGQVIDSDPFGRTASTSSVNRIRAIVPFRKALFCSSDNAQFELTSNEALTPLTAQIDVATKYTSEHLCRPLGFRDELYFASKSGSSAVLFEYYYSDTSVGHTANDVLIHASGYVPAPITHLVSDTVTGTIMALSGTDRSTIYVYKTFWNGEEKAQSSWSKWSFGTGTIIQNFTNLDGHIYIALTRGGNLIVEKISLNENEKPSQFKYPVRLDALQYIVGTYDSSTQLTTFVSDYALDFTKMTAVTTTENSPAGSKGIVINPLTVTPSFNAGNGFFKGRFTLAGDKSGVPIYLGINYTMSVELSKQYLREGNDNATVTTGRLQLKRIYFDYKDSAFLQAVVTPHLRPSKTYTFNGSTVGGSIQASPDLLDGVFDAPVRSDGTTVKIKLINPSYLPCTVTSARWVGFFNEMTRQE